MVRRSPSAQTAGLDPPCVEGLLTPPPPPQYKKRFAFSVLHPLKWMRKGPAPFQRIFRDFSPQTEVLRTWLKIPPVCCLAIKAALCSFFFWAFFWSLADRNGRF